MMIGKQERIRISLAPSKIKLTAILKCKSLGPSLDSNLACSDRMPSLHHLCHHQCHGAAFVEFFFSFLSSDLNFFSDFFRP